MNIPKELAPYFENCFLLGFSICTECGESVAFNSKHKKFSDDYWLDEAAAMKENGWVVPVIQEPYCKSCAKKLKFKHNPEAFEVNLHGF